MINRRKVRERIGSETGSIPSESMEEKGEAAKERERERERERRNP